MMWQPGAGRCVVAMRVVLAAGCGWLVGACGITDVEPGPLAALEIAVSPVLLAPGQVVKAELTARDARGRAISLPPVEWLSSDASVLAVDSAGQVTGVAPGRTTVSARAGSVVDSVELRVGLDGLYPQGAVIPYPGSTFGACTSLRLSAQTEPLVPDAQFLWRTSDARVLEVDSTGRIRALSPGVVELSAQWTRDTAVSAVRTFTVRAEEPVKPVSIQNVHRSGGAPVLQLDSVTGVVGVHVRLFVYTYIGGVLELRIGDTVVKAEPWPTNCPPQFQSVVLDAIDTRLLANGPTHVEARHIRTGGEVAARDSLAIIIRN